MAGGLVRLQAFGFYGIVQNNLLFGSDVLILIN